MPRAGELGRRRRRRRGGERDGERERDVLGVLYIPPPYERVRRATLTPHVGRWALRTRDEIYVDESVA